MFLDRIAAAKGSKSGGPPMRAARDDLAAAQSSNASFAAEAIEAGASLRTYSKLPFCSRKQVAEGIDQLSRRAEATVAPAGPRTILNG